MRGHPNPLPYAPDGPGDPAVTARHNDLTALVSQIPGINRRTTGPRYCGCGHTPARHALHADDHPCRACACDTYRGADAA